jgi:hypothetical protein
MFEISTNITGKVLKGTQTNIILPRILLHYFLHLQFQIDLHKKNHFSEEIS